MFIQRIFGMITNTNVKYTLAMYEQFSCNFPEMIHILQKIEYASIL